MDKGECPGMHIQEGKKAICLIWKAPYSSSGTFLFTTKPIFTLNAWADY